MEFGFIMHLNGENSYILQKKHIKCLKFCALNIKERVLMFKVIKCTKQCLHITHGTECVVINLNL